LFNYFNSKKDLYVYLVEHCVQVIEWFFGQIDVSETDLFKRIEDIGLQKMHIHQTYPQVFDFLAASIQEESPEVKDIIKQKWTPSMMKGRKSCMTILTILCSETISILKKRLKY